MNTIAHNQITKKAVIYCRVSTKEQVEEGNSLVTQEKICKDYAYKNGYEIAEVFIEQGESAKTAERKELQRLIAYCENRKNQISNVIAYKIDRISRNVYDYSKLRISFKRHGIDIKSASEHFEDNPAGRFMDNIIANVAQFDNDVRAERSVGGMKEAMHEGRYVWAAPLGYDNVRISGKSNIVLNDMAPLVRKAFETVAKNTFPSEEVRKIIAKEGLVTKSGKAISKSQFNRLLKNEIYAGWIIKFGERHKGNFAPMVTQELFDQVQRVLKYRGRSNFHYLLENPDFPLRRFVMLPSGKKLTGGWSKGKTKKYPYYCFRSEHLSFRKHIMEGMFKNFFDQFRINENDYSLLLNFIKENFTKATEDQNAERIRLQRQIKELKEKQNMLVQKNYKGIISDTVMQQQLEFIEQELLDAHASHISIPEKERSIEKLLGLAYEFLKSPGNVWEKAAFKERLELQWFNFPQGIIFDGSNLRTQKISSVFNAKQMVLPSELHKADFVHQIPNNPEITKSDQYWELFANDLEKLSRIIQRIGLANPP